MPLFLTFFVLALGVSVNVHNSGDEVDSIQEAKERTVEAVKEGFTQDGFVSHKLND